MIHKQSMFRKGRAIDTIFIVLILLGIGYGIHWIIKAGGKATQEYGQGMVNTRDQSMALSCQMNMRSIFQLLQVAVTTDWAYPESYSDLKNLGGDSRLFHCPDPNGSEYVYVRPRQVDSDKPEILLFETNPVHLGQCNVLLTSGQIVQMPPDDLRK